MPSAATRLLIKTLNYTGRGSRVITYLLRDEFTSGDTNTPRTAVPGPGTLNTVATNGTMSITGGKLQFGGKTVQSFTTQGWYGEKAGGGAFSRVCGRTLFGILNLGDVSTASPEASSVMGWNGAAGIFSTPIHCFFQQLAFAAISGNSGSPQLKTNALAINTDYYSALMLRTTGAFLFLKGGASYPEWEHVATWTTDATASLYPAFTNSGHFTPGTLDSAQVRDLASPFDTDYGYATLNVASPSGQYTNTADCNLYLTVTSPASLTQECGIKFREVDANNYLRAYFNTSGALRLDKVVAGTPTNLINVAGVITTSVTRTIWVAMKGSTVDLFSFAPTTWTKRGSTQTITEGATATTVEPDVGNYTVADLRSFPRTSAALTAALNFS